MSEADCLKMKLVNPIFCGVSFIPFRLSVQAVRQAAVGSELMVIKERQYAVELTIGIKMSVPVFVLYPFVFTVVETGKIIDDATV
jgi:hypothetical protein